MVNLTSLAENAYIGARKWLNPKSFSGLRYIPKNSERDIVEIIQKPAIVGTPLNKASEECEFFGVDSFEHIEEKILNHDKFYRARKNWCINFEIGSILDFQDVNMNKKGIQGFKEYLSEKLFLRGRNWSRIQELDSQHSARMTCASEIFGTNPYGYPMLHTVGLVSKNGNLYILDSLGEQNLQLKEFHSMLREIFKDFGYRKIIISTKPQQPMTELTCNNWTYANIESVLNAIIKEYKKIETVEELNKVLPEDINKILKMQYQEALWTD